MIPVNDLRRSFELFQDEYEEAALSVLRSGWYVLGNEVNSFETEFATSLGGSCECAGVANGLDAIMLGLKAAGIGEGDEVIVQANGYIATMLGILQCGAVPVFVEPDAYYQLDAAGIEKAVTERTKAVLVTHLYGQATRMDEILAVCDQNGLLLFEDCAQSHFAAYKGTNTGLFGTAGFFSFYPTKNLGAFGDAGAVVSKDSELIRKVKVLRNYGSDRRYHNIETGFNMRLDELQAGLLRVKLKHMPEILKNREEIAKRYLAGISNPAVSLPAIAADCTHTWYQFIIRVDKQAAFREFLKERGVATDISWEVPPYLQPCMVERFGYKTGDFPVTEELCAHIVTLPMMDYMDEAEIDTVIRAVNAYRS
ncbi:MAG: DegT/DnrJ/EryC1/StrS family aminotransferase [Lachnospiraceae bacterium]|nr:DegT/DnrJ/EryC1/StrS family aminotransferase [Lachnospiraceae bacterium]